MSRIEYRLPLVLVLTVLAPCVLLGQQSPEAQQHLAAAAQALNSIDSKSPAGESGKALAVVRRDFADMQRALSGSSDSNSSAAGQTDWRTKYSAIERDLTGLIGSVNTSPGQPAAPAVANAAPLDAPTRVALEDFRNHVELFYAAMTGGQPPAAAATGASTPTEATASQQAAPPPPQPTQTAPTQPTQMTQPTQSTAGAQPAAQPAVDSEGASALLDRMQTILDAALGNRSADTHAVATSGVLPGVDSKSKAGKISVDRAALDEVLAEVQQLRTMLRVRQ